MNIKNYIKGGAFIALTMLAVACSSDDEYTGPSCPAPVAGTTGTAIDLGLTSGTLWADHNVGATSPEDYGNYYGWGDPTGLNRSKIIADYAEGESMTVEELFEAMKTTYDAEAGRDTTALFTADPNVFAERVAVTNDEKGNVTYAFVMAVEGGKDYDAEDHEYTTDDYPIMVVYAKEGKVSLGYVNITYAYKGSNADIYANSINGYAAYDAATANWGSGWAMPNTEQITELIEECTWERSDKGYTVTGPNGNSIFLPFAGYRYGDELFATGSEGFYWSGVITGTYTFPTGPQQLNGSQGDISTADTPAGLYLSGTKYAIQSTFAYGKAVGMAIRPVK
ncbi:MAG: hypothetical protein IJV17_05835 [Prevotella sp.]|nr:hypothetical protein [Prevotella sp.]